MIGGYVLIDCKGLNLLSQSSQTVAGLHERVTEAVKTGKPVFACNCTYGDGVPSTPISVMVIDESGTWIATSSILQILVAANDAVTIRNLLTIANRTAETKTAVKAVKK